jgi:hypothetical protein
MSAPKERELFEYKAAGIKLSTPLGFLALVLVLACTTLGGLAAQSEKDRLLLAAGLLGLMMILTSLVVVLAVRWPGALTDSRPVRKRRAASNERRARSAERGRHRS